MPSMAESAVDDEFGAIWDEVQDFFEKHGFVDDHEMSIGIKKVNAIA